jgi:hypothetical protein
VIDPPKIHRLLNKLRKSSGGATHKERPEDGAKDEREPRQMQEQPRLGAVSVPHSRLVSPQCRGWF